MADRNHSRRFFLKAGSALAGLSFLPAPLISHAERAATPPEESKTYAYPNPGRIAIVEHPGAVLGYNNVDETVVQYMFDQGIMQLAGIYTSPAAALASFFPGLTTSKKIAIKPNFLNSKVPTRKELMKAVLNRLTQMLSGFPAANITIYERHSFSGVGYTTSYLGHNVNLVRDSTFPNLGYTIHCDGKDRPYSQSLHEADYLINMPVLKDHSCGTSMNMTLAFKNHMGTVNPGGSLGIHCNKDACLDIMASSVMTTKQRLCIMDALYAVYNGGPGGNPQATPNKIFLSQDPVALDSQGRVHINNLRTANSLNPKAATYIDQAAASPYSLGVANPLQQQIININLPVKLALFTAALDRGEVKLRWRTEGESNNRGFGIERSGDGQHDWQQIGFVDGAGSTSEAKEYAFTDSDSAALRQSRTMFYRLRQVNTDGTHEYSAHVEIALQLDAASWNLEPNYPNPFTGRTDLPVFMPSETHMTLDVYDMKGARVQQLFSGSLVKGMHYFTFDADELPAGTYVARAMADGVAKEIRMVLTK
ncbi:MAG: hypothetical protein C0600_08645 [Ignavibacteria bacterium]|nr:MAG: hypothetical protein C0600_08645 [Ignavibacteria bacterium]